MGQTMEPPTNQAPAGPPSTAPEQTPEQTPPPRSGAASALGAAAAIRAAREQFSTLTGHPPGTVTGARPIPDGGWSVLIDVVELERIPDSTSVIATYRVDVNNSNEFTACERLRRYTRGTTDL
jgi:hypothetical protein